MQPGAIMRLIQLRATGRPQGFTLPMKETGRPQGFALTNRYLHAVFFIAIALLLVACSGGGSSGGTQPPANATTQAVNGFGVAANHVHSLVALPSHVLVMATHYG